MPMPPRADDMLRELLRRDIVDTIGVPTTPDPGDGTLRRGAVKTGLSPWSDDEMQNYEIEVTTWTDPNHDIDAEHFKDAALSDEDVMFFLVGTGWSLSARHGAPDAVIPSDLAEQILDAFPDGGVWFHHGIPEARWFEKRFRTAHDLIDSWRMFGLAVEHDPTPWPLDPYLEECLEDDTFASVFLGPPFMERDIRVRVLIDDHYADTAMMFGRSYFDPEPESSLVAGDGWVIEVVGTDVGESGLTYAFAAAIATASGGRYIGPADPGRDRQMVDAKTRFGPQTANASRLVLAVAAFERSCAYDDWTDEQEAAWGRVEAALVGSGRHDQLEHALDEVSMAERRDFSKHAGRHAMAGLVARDLITTADYDLLTAEWRGVLGPIHPDDPRLPRRQPRGGWVGGHTVGHDDDEDSPRSRGTRAFVYRYFVADEDAEAATFECRAADDDDADRQVKAAGLQDVVLYEVVKVDRRLRSDALSLRLRQHPFLGPEWEPIVELLHEVTENMRDGFWRMQVVRPLDDVEDGGMRPFMQAMRRPDGTVQVEVGGTPVSHGIDRRRRAELDFFGWMAPDPSENLPLPFLILEAEWTGRAIAQRVIEALTVVYDVDAKDLFAFGGRAREVAASGRFGLEPVGEDVYVLPATTARR